MIFKSMANTPSDKRPERSIDGNAGRPTRDLQSSEERKRSCEHLYAEKQYLTLPDCSYGQKEGVKLRFYIFN